MLTRLKVNGFKNLVDVDVYFGPFTCVAGANGVGKSNLFDAIRFLSALADKPLVEAALSVRDEGGRTADIRGLFHRVGDRYDTEMSFEAEMIVPRAATDDLGQTAEASITFLRYSLTLAYRRDDAQPSGGAIELVEEELKHINLGDARASLPFPHSPQWRKSALTGHRFGAAFISTVLKDPRQVMLHQDGSAGRPLARLAANLPRTVLSVATAAESRTALAARREMQSWRLLQLEPSALRKPDEFSAPPRLGMDGSHLAATLYRLARRASTDRNGRDPSSREGEKAIYAQVANRLAELISDARSIRVDRDERRELMTLYLRDRSGTEHPARALSDGTLRFLALTVLELESDAPGLLCLEEPENGIHPERIPAMLRLLQDIATDPNEPLDADNPLRQVIVNTHSPAVVLQVPEHSLLVAEPYESATGDQHFPCVRFSPLDSTWRAKAPNAVRPVALGDLLVFLNPVEPAERLAPLEPEPNGRGRAAQKSHRVVDRSDLQAMFQFADTGL